MPSPLLLLGLLAAALAQAPSPGSQLIRQGRPRAAAKNAQAAVARDPEDAEAWAVLGAARAKAGSYGDAAMAFIYGQGSTYYEDVLGLEMHADALQARGLGEQAAELRRQALLRSDLDASREMRLWLGLAEDLRVAGRYEDALDAAATAEGMFPRSPQVHAVQSEIHLDAGQLDLAEQYLRLADDEGGTLLACVVHARLAIAEGDLDEADIWLDAAKAFRSRTQRLAALRAEVLRLQGDPYAAIALLRQQNWSRSDEPHVVAARIHAHVDAEEWQDADEWARLGRRMSAAHPVMQEALAYLDARRPPG